MYNHYWITKKEKKDGFHHLHGLGCPKLSRKKKKVKFLKEVFQNSVEALEAAKRIYPNSKPCKKCCPSCFNQNNTHYDEETIH